MRLGMENSAGCDEKQCPRCKKRFTTVGNRNRHLSTSSRWAPCGTPRIQCTECPKTFGRLDDLRRHVLFTHSDDDMREVALAHLCDICGSKFSTPYKLRRHMAVHASGADRERFECTECRVRLATRSSLKRHDNEVHKRKDRHKCTQCTASFRSSRLVIQHVNRAAEAETAESNSSDRSNGPMIDHSQLLTSSSTLYGVYTRKEKGRTRELCFVGASGEVVFRVHLHSIPSSLLDASETELLPRVHVQRPLSPVLRLQQPTAPMCVYGGHPITPNDVFNVLNGEFIRQWVLEPLLSRLVERSGRDDVQYISMGFIKAESGGRAVYNHGLRPSVHIGHRSRLIVPIFLDFHFALAVMDFGSRIVQLWDSDFADEGRRTRQDEFLRRVWRGVYRKGPSVPWNMTIARVASLRQPDATSCGALLVYYLVNYLNGDLVRNSQESVDGVPAPLSNGSFKVLSLRITAEIRRRIVIPVMLSSGCGRQLLATLIE